VAGRRISVENLIQELEDDRAFYDTSGGGVTFSGGEPLAQPAFLGALLQACRAGGIHTVVDTCGFASWNVVDRVRHTVDLFLYDVKLVDEPRHEHFTGVSNQPILRNLQRLSELGHASVLRFPLIPGVNDQPADIAAVAALAAGLPSLRRVDLLPYHRMAATKYAGLGRTYNLAHLRPPTQRKVAEAAGLLEQAGLSVQVGG
jgi:pyruvate formate lyase activating enzyme